VRIAQVAPLYESVPPQQYGGTERVVSFLTEELVRQGHDVTLFASGDSVTAAELVPICPRALRLSGTTIDPTAHHVRQIEIVCRRAPAFDVIHFHTDYLHFPISRRMGWPAITTLHGRLDLPDLAPLYDEFGDMPVVSISDAQRDPLPAANWIGTIYHGLPPGLFRFSPRAEGYLAFLGRISPEKRVDRAVEIARRTGRRLRVAAKIDRADREYFEREIAPLFEEPFVEFLGEIDDAGKQRLLGGATALLFPIDWCEPFGLVMIEALACGTPVIAWPGGSVGEVLDDPRSGIIVTSLDEAAAAVDLVAALDRRGCRDVFESRFTVARMAAEYLTLYGLVSPAGAAGAGASESDHERAY
jgi:glycosyltransferase involved in cell wall biosynthesis